MSARKREPIPVDPQTVGIYYVVERLGPGGWKQIEDSPSYGTALEAQWARAELHVKNKALSLSATRVISWSWT